MNKNIIAFSVLFFVISLVPFNYFKLSVTATQAYYVIIASIVFVLMISVIYKQWHITRYELSICLIIICLSASLMQSVDRLNTVKAIMSFIVKGLCISVIAERIFANKKDILRDMVVLCAVIISMTGLVEYFGNILLCKFLNPYHWLVFKLTADHTYANYALTERSGIASTIGHPNVLAAYLVMVLPMAIYYLNIKRTLFAYIPTLCIGIVILLCFSRGAWIAAFIMAMIYLFSHKPIYFSRVSIGITGVAVILLAVIVILSPLKSQLKSALYQRFHSIETFASSHRAAAYSTAMRIVKDYPFFGVGLGNYSRVHEKYHTEGSDVSIATPDNMYLRFLCEIGAVGTAIIVGVICYWIGFLWKNRNDDYIFSLCAGLTAFLVNMATCDLMQWIATQFLFWMLLGAGVGYSSTLLAKRP
jgi:O-antigen ligase